MESQIDSFEAELEGLTVKKGKTRPPRLVRQNGKSYPLKWHNFCSLICWQCPTFVLQTHLETSITRHKAHIMKLELILRLLDNDELSPEQVNDVKDLLEDYVERNQVFITQNFITSFLQLHVLVAILRSCNIEEDLCNESSKLINFWISSEKKNIGENLPTISFIFSLFLLFEWEAIYVLTSGSLIEALYFLYSFL